MKLTWYEDKLLHLTNATDYATNFFNVPVVAYNGDKDAQKQAADVMAASMEKEGLALSRVTGTEYRSRLYAGSHRSNRRNDGCHRAERAGPVSARGALHHLDLEYNRMRWVVVDGLEKHWEQARVNAELEGDHKVKATTSNISAFSFVMEPGAGMLNPAAKTNVVLDGQTIAVPGASTNGSWTAHFRKTDEMGIAGADSNALNKRHDLQGPIDDAYMDSFLMVRPTGAPMNEMVGKWAKSEMDHAVKLWRTQMRGDAPVKDDSVVTDADIAANNLVLMGRSTEQSGTGTNRGSIADSMDGRRCGPGDAAICGCDECAGDDLSEPAEPEKVCGD